MEPFSDSWWAAMTSTKSVHAGRVWWGWGTIPELRQQFETMSKTLGTPLYIPPTVEQAARLLRFPRLQIQSLPSSLRSIFSDEPFERLLHSRGRDMVDILRNTRGYFDDVHGQPVDLVAFPQDENQLLAIFQFCSERRIAVIFFGGGSSVVFGLSPPSDSAFSACISVDLFRFDRILEINETSQSVHVQGGVYGPALEKALKPSGLTLRYFPQSFEFSTVGGWLATRGGGHFATGPTHIDDMCESLRVVSPKGVTMSRRLPSSGAGVSEKGLYLGSEGAFGAITSAWLKLRPRPTLRTAATVVFIQKEGNSISSFLQGAQAVRAISQSGLLPANLRLVDGSEVGRMAKRSGLERTAVLLLGFESARSDEAELDEQLRSALRLCQTFGGIAQETSWAKAASSGQRDSLAGQWGSGFMKGGYGFSVALLFGVLMNTVETCCTWDSFPRLHAAVHRAVADTVAQVCPKSKYEFTCRFTHIYSDGPAPYYTLLIYPSAEVASATQAEGCDVRLRQWQHIKAAAMHAIMQNGGTATHHHAVGKLHRPSNEEERGALFTNCLQAVKAVHDPAGICNPDVYFCSKL